LTKRLPQRGERAARHFNMTKKHDSLLRPGISRVTLEQIAYRADLRRAFSNHAHPFQRTVWFR
jgi:hypothetical protein